MDDRANLGTWGEREAERFLRRLGYRIVTRNYHCPVGEIDVVALDGAMIVFVEVKTRADRDHADPEDAVHAGKQHRLTRSANYFLRQTGSVGRACRFDIVAVCGTRDSGIRIEHFQNAFLPN